MRDDPGLDVGKIAACLNENYGVNAASISFLPIGHDMNAFVYEVVADGGTSYFLKIRSGPLYEPSLLVPRALIDLGVQNVIAPLRTNASQLWCPLDGYGGYTVVLYPFVRGKSAKVSGMSDGQWRAFGATLGAVHASGLGDHFRDQLRVEDFALPSAAKVRRVSDLVESTRFESVAAERLAAFWGENSERIGRVLEHAEELGRSLQAKPFELVLCHSDVHAANILTGRDDALWLVDWDSPLIAPRERDLLFVVGSRIARVVEPEDEDHFFEGYGPFEIDRDVLIYYRYERIVEDLGEFGESVFLSPTISERWRAHEAELAMGFFAPGGDVDRAEVVPRTCWPGRSE
jgi:spectinomycin phosphotransferase